MRLTPAHRRRLLVGRHHLGATASDPLAATRDLVALHSTDPATPYLSLRARVGGFDRQHLDTVLLEDRSLWRLHSIRRTLFIVPARDGRHFQGAAGWEVARTERKRLLKWVENAEGGGRDGRWLAGVETDTLESLSGGVELRTQELTAAVAALETRITLGAGKWTTTSPLSSRLLFVLAMEGKIVRTRTAGSWRASQYRWARADGWFPAEVAEPAGIPDPSSEPDTREEEARAALLRRYLTAFGPATLDDIRWWAGWTKGKAAAALAAVGAAQVRLAGEDGGDVGEGYLLPDDIESAAALEGARADDEVVTFLPALDPTPMGWKERAFYLGEHATFGGPLFDRNGNVGPTIWLGGRVVGGWAQRPDGEVVWRLLEDVGSEAEARVADEAGRLAEWLAGEVVTPRFPTPLQRALAGG